MTLREYSGNAQRTSLNGGISASDTTIAVASGTGYPTGSTAPFVITLEAGTTAEERVLIASRSGNNLTVAASGRGWDGTTASSHANTATVDHTFSATDARDANGHINDTTLDHHTQYAWVKKGLAALRGAAGRSMKLHYGTDTGYLSVDDGTSWHDFQDKTAADAAYPSLLLVDAKGDLLVGSADNTVVRKAVGTDGQVLTADAASAGGVKWATGAKVFAGARGVAANPGLTHNTETLVPFTSETFDTDGFHDNVTNNTRFTVPAGLAGKYQVNAGITFTANSTGRRYCAIAKNGAIVAYGMTTPPLGTGDNTLATVADIVSLAVGDYVEIYAYQSSGGSLAIAVGNNVSYASLAYLGA